MYVRRAMTQDIPQLERLLSQVLEVHHAGRPDLFKPNARKYTTEQLEDIVCDNAKPVFVATSEADQSNVLGYAFCVCQQHIDDNILTDVKTLYIDDLCVDEASRGMHVGRKLYEHVLGYARKNGFYNVTLNVWALNDDAKGFYEHLGLKPQKHTLETIL